MILEAVITIIFNLAKYTMGLLPDLPDLPVEITNSINDVLDIIFDNIHLLGLVVNVDLLKIIVPIYIVVHYFSDIYAYVMWVLRKIPLSID